MLGQILRALRQAMPVHIVRMSVEPDRDLADATRHQQVLLRPDHAHRHIGLAVQQILHPIAQHQFHAQLRMRSTQRSQDRRQDFRTDHLAGRDPDRALHRLTMTAGCALQRRGNVGHRPCMAAQRLCGVGRQ